jgi:thiamine-phosphate pyrophosphorylase
MEGGKTVARIPSDKMKAYLKLYFIMGSQNCLKDPRKTLLEAIKGGITLFQFREKGTGALTGQAKVDLARELQLICKEHHIPFIVNDDLDLALELKADGVHIGQEDAPAGLVREQIGPDRILGVSAHTLEEAAHAIEQGADYLGIGPIYPTTTKEDAKPAKGMVLVQALRNLDIKFPIVGIGGIKPTNAEQVVKEGADGVSIITAISHAEHPSQATTALAKAVHID